MKPLHVPECPPGWRTAPPDFVGVGAQRSGTSWWYRTLEQHPRIVDRLALGQAKELHYFSRAWDGTVHSDMAERGAPEDVAARYGAFFPRPAGHISGEWTPDYMHGFWSLAPLRRAAPDARILVLLRDPAERLISGVAQKVRNRARRGEDRDVIPERTGSMLQTTFADALHRGLYHQQILRVFELFPRRQVLILQYERCAADPATELERTCRFLGLEPFSELPARVTTRDGSPHPKQRLADEMREEILRRLEPDVRRLAALCPEVDLSLWPNFRHLAPTPAPDTRSGAPALR
jgi:hypothetical protein